MLPKLFTLFLLFITIILTQATEHETVAGINGPGLQPREIVMPARYFFVNLTTLLGIT